MENMTPGKAEKKRERGRERKRKRRRKKGQQRTHIKPTKAKPTLVDITQRPKNKTLEKAQKKRRGKENTRTK